jgi:hypothetical protein
MRTSALVRAALPGIACWLLSSGLAHAQMSIGTWVKQNSGAHPITLVIESCCSGGRRLVYHVQGGAQKEFTMTIETALDGTDAPVIIAGRPSGETMGIKRLDDRHATCVLKFNGKPFGTSHAAISADGNTMTVENEVTSAAGGQQPGKTTETWIRQ